MPAVIEKPITPSWSATDVIAWLFHFIASLDINGDLSAFANAVWNFGTKIIDVLRSSPVSVLFFAAVWTWLSYVVVLQPCFRRLDRLIGRRRAKTE